MKSSLFLLYLYSFLKRKFEETFWTQREKNSQKLCFNRYDIDRFRLISLPGNNLSTLFSRIFIFPFIFKWERESQELQTKIFQKKNREELISAKVEWSEMFLYTNIHTFSQYQQEWQKSLCLDFDYIIWKFIYSWA